MNATSGTFLVPQSTFPKRPKPVEKKYPNPTLTHMRRTCKPHPTAQLATAGSRPQMAFSASAQGNQRADTAAGCRGGSGSTPCVHLIPVEQRKPLGRRRGGVSRAGSLTIAAHPAPHVPIPARKSRSAGALSWPCTSQCRAFWSAIEMPHSRSVC